MRSFLLATLIVIVTGCQSASTNINKNKDIVQSTRVVELADSVLLGELIDGPANIRDTVNGKILYSLFNDVPVESTDTSNMWVQVGLVIDLTPLQFKVLRLEMGDTIFLNNRQVGITLDKVRLRAGIKRNEELRGELVGYTSFKNIKKNTIPEYEFERIVNHVPTLTVDSFTSFFREMRFQSSDNKHFVGFLLDENWIDDPSPLLRLWVLFNHGKLFGVVHSRKLKLNKSSTYKVNRGFTLSIVGDQDPNLVNDFVKEFNEYINQAD
jgi:hypothetical protein